MDQDGRNKKFCELSMRIFLCVEYITMRQLGIVALVLVLLSMLMYTSYTERFTSRKCRYCQSAKKLIAYDGTETKGGYYCPICDPPRGYGDGSTGSGCKQEAPKCLDPKAMCIMGKYGHQCMILPPRAIGKGGLYCNTDGTCDPGLTCERSVCVTKEMTQCGDASQCESHEACVIGHGNNLGVCVE